MKDAAAAVGGEIQVESPPGEPARLTVSGVADAEAMRAWLHDAAAAIRERLREHGQLLIKGLPITGTEDFAVVRDELVTTPARHPREETTPRSAYGDGIFSATDAPPMQTIGLHNEDSYSVVFPGLLLFCCLVAPETGGATTVGDCRRLLRTLPAQLVERFRARGWLMRRTFQDHMGIPWQHAFGTESQSDVEKYCDEQRVGWQWLDDGRLRTTSRRPGIVRHPVTGEESWFNHVAVFNEWTLEAEVRELLVEACGPDGLPQNTYYGDGSPVDREDVDLLNRCYADSMVEVRWQPGDLLLVDNILCTHGRQPYTGDRRVLVAMGDPVNLADCAPPEQIGTEPISATTEVTP